MHGPYGLLRSAPAAGLADHTAWTGAPALPPRYLDALMPALPVENQEQSSMCVAFAASEARRWWLRRLGVADVELSAPYIYARGHQVAGQAGEGMQPLWAMQALERYGVAPWADDPLQPSTEDVAESEAASPTSLDGAAAAYRIAAAGPVTPGPALQAAILHAPVLIAIPVYTEMGIENPVSDGAGDWNVLPPANASSAQVVGGHAIVAWGWKTDAAGRVWTRVRNSWGASWAAEGNAWLAPTHPIWEAWSLTCAAPAPPPTPSPTPPPTALDLALPFDSTSYTLGGTRHVTASPLLANYHDVDLAYWLAQVLGARAAWDGKTLTVTR